MDKKNKKMKSGVMVRPRKPKEWLILVLMVATIIPCVSPVVNLFNKNTLVLGMPPLFLLSIIALIAVIVVVNIAYKMGVK